MAIAKQTTTEYELFAEYKRTKDKKIRDELLKKYLYIAQILSRKFINRGIEYDDIYQVACMGVLYAIERFDPDRGVQFATFATPTVMGEIRRYFRDKGNFIRIPRTLYEVFYKAECIRRASNEKTPEDIARILNIPEKTIKKAFEIGDTSFIKSLEDEAYADGPMTLANTIGREDNDILMIEENDFIQYCMQSLSDKEKEFIKFRYYNDQTQAQIAKSWGVSQMQISRFEKNLLKKLNRMYFKE